MNRNDLMLSIDQDESDSVIGWIPSSGNQEIIFSEDFNFNAVEDEREGNSEYIESSSMLELVNLNQTEATEEHHEDSDEVPCEMVTGDASYSVVSSFMSTNLKSVIISDRFDFVGVASKGKLVRPIVWKVTEVCGKLERVVSMVYVLGNKLITVSDHYRFRLLVMGWSSNCVDFWIMGRSKGVVATTPLSSPFGNGNGVQSQLLLLDAAGLSIKQPVIILEMKILGIFSLRVGKLADNKISWGGNSGFRDGSELKLDVSKGMHYALDYKQIGFPLTFTVIVLPFPILEYGDRIEEVNQLETTQEFVPKAVKIAAAMVSTFLMFQAASVNVHYVEDESVPTGICVVCVVGGEWLLFANLLATNCYKSERLKRSDNWAFVENATYFYIAGIFLMVSLDYMQLVVEQAIGINNVFSLNLFVPFSCEFFKDALEEVLPNMDFILGNETEASIFSKVHGRVTNDVANESSKIWNLLKGSATTLDVLSIVFGEEILPTLILVIQAKLSTRADKTWNARVAIIWAIVAIGESCITGFSPQMSKIADNAHQKGYEQIEATLMGLL